MATMTKNRTRSRSPSYAPPPRCRSTSKAKLIAGLFSPVFQIKSEPKEPKKDGPAGTGEIYQAEGIIDRRKYKGKLQYRVKWQGYPVEEATWEPYENIAHCQEFIDDYNESMTSGKIGSGKVKRPRSSKSGTPEEQIQKRAPAPRSIVKTAKKRPAGITEMDVMDTDASEEEECREPVDIKPDPVRTVAATTLTDPDNRSRDIKLTSVPVVLADTTSPVLAELRRMASKAESMVGLSYKETAGDAKAVIRFRDEKDWLKTYPLSYVRLVLPEKLADFYRGIISAV